MRYAPAHLIPSNTVRIRTRFSVFFSHERRMIRRTRRRSPFSPRRSSVRRCALSDAACASAVPHPLPRPVPRSGVDSVPRSWVFSTPRSGPAPSVHSEAYSRRRQCIPRRTPPRTVRRTVCFLRRFPHRKSTPLHSRSLRRSRRLLSLCIASANSIHCPCAACSGLRTAAIAFPPQKRPRLQ